jgi:hypothetical protein
MSRFRDWALAPDPSGMGPVMRAFAAQYATKRWLGPERHLLALARKNVGWAVRGFRCRKTLALRRVLARVVYRRELQPDLARLKAHTVALERTTEALRKFNVDSEVRALRKEAKNWAEIRDSYREFAATHTGEPRRKAQEKAAEFDRKLRRAREDLSSELWAHVHSKAQS